MGKKNNAPVRKTIEVEIDCDASRLHGSLCDAAKYLLEIEAAYPGTGITLEEVWTGYEDMHMAFTYFRDETDEEMVSRVEREKAAAEYARVEAERKAAHERDMEKYHELSRKLGLR